MITDIINVVDTLSEAKDVEREVIFEAIENALESTTKKKYTENNEKKKLVFNYFSIQQYQRSKIS